MTKTLKQIIEKIFRIKKRSIREDPTYRVAEMLYDDAESAYRGTDYSAPNNAKGCAMQRVNDASERLERIGRELARKGYAWSEK